MQADSTRQYIQYPINLLKTCFIFVLAPVHEDETQTLQTNDAYPGMSLLFSPKPI